jgi:hypothetical protein
MPMPELSDSNGRIEMTAGLLDYLPKVMNVISETGVSFDEALEIVAAAHEPKPESNVIYGVDFSRRQAEDKNGLA